MTLVPLREICQIKHGGTPSKSNPAYWIGPIPWISPKDMKASLLADASDHISEEALRNSATSLVPKDTVLVVARSGILTHTLPVARAGRPMAFNQDIKALVPNTEKVDAEYLYWFIKASERELLTRGVKKGATVHSLQSGAIENLLVPLPSRPEQRRIADLLGRAEGIVRLRREAQLKTVAITPSLFYEMFGDPTANPKGFTTSRFGEVIVSADYGTSSKASEEKIGLPVIRMGNVDYRGYLDLSDLKYAQLDEAEVERYRLRPGDILFNRTNSKDLVGKTGLWDGSMDAIAASYFIRVRVNEQRIRPFFAWAYMNSAYMKRVLLETARGAIGQANINARELRSFRMLLPPLQQQEQFEERCRTLLSIKAQQKRATIVSEMSFQALLSRVFHTQHVADDALAKVASAKGLLQ